MPSAVSGGAGGSRILNRRREGRRAGSIFYRVSNERPRTASNRVGYAFSPAARERVRDLRKQHRGRTTLDAPGQPITV